jgi:hypothetical protein
MDITFEQATSLQGTELLRLEAAKQDSVRSYLIGLGYRYTGDALFSAAGNMARLLEHEAGVTESSQAQANRYSFLLGSVLGIHILRTFLSPELQERAAMTPLFYEVPGSGIKPSQEHIISRVINTSDDGWQKFGKAYEGLLQGWGEELFYDERHPRQTNKLYMQRGMGVIFSLMDTAQFGAELDGLAVLEVDWNSILEESPGPSE